MARISVLTCGGIEKDLGLVTNELALKLTALDPTIKLLSFALLCTNKEKYQEIIKESTIIVIDGCATRCAAKLLENQEYKKTKRIFLPDEYKKIKSVIDAAGGSTEEKEKIIALLAQEIIKELKEDAESSVESIIEKEFGDIEYHEISYDKYQFKVPKEGYYFTENDCWVKPEGTKALLGITDYLQNNTGDILFADLPKVDSEIEQFDEVVELESVKAVVALISPVSGKIIAVNAKLKDEPNLMNEDAYEQGWAVEIELTAFEEEKKFLMDGEQYFEYMKKKIEKEL
ncbi:MAG: glycine cleavage system protein GcvH [Asgard group archaeon]|nr:glycine cleavage system protein GcvH [Asgard group archaeon]